MFTTNHINFIFQLNVFNLPMKLFILLCIYITHYNIFCWNIDNIIQLHNIFSGLYLKQQFVKFTHNCCKYFIISCGFDLNHTQKRNIYNYFKHFYLYCTTFYHSALFWFETFKKKEILNLNWRFNHKTDNNKHYKSISNNEYNYSM